MKMALFSRHGLIVLLAIALFTLPDLARAELKIDITRGNVEPLPIAIVEFRGDVDEAARIGTDLSGEKEGDVSMDGLLVKRRT